MCLRSQSEMCQSINSTSESCLSHGFWANMQFFRANVPFFTDYFLYEYFQPHFCHVTITWLGGEEFPEKLKNRLLFIYFIRKASNPGEKIMINIFDVMLT